MAQVASEAKVGAGEAEILADGAGEVIGRSPTQLFWRRFRRDRYAIAGLTFIIILAALALGAPVFAKLTSHGANEHFIYTGTAPDGLPLGPSTKFWFGHDQLGQDLFIRVLYGARTSMAVAIFATGVSVVIGIILGLIAGFYRGWVDTLVSRIIDIMMTLPILLLALGLAAVCASSPKGCLGGHLHVTGTPGLVMWVVAAAFAALGLYRIGRHHAGSGVMLLLVAAGFALTHFRVAVPSIQPGLTLVILIIAFANWTYIARIVRGQVLSLREKEFVESSYATGATDIRIMLREILPNVAMPIIVYSSLVIPANILFEAALSYLGVGVPITTPSWGAMISDATTGGLYLFAWWFMVFPGLFLFLTTFAFNLLGDGLRDALDPKTAK